MCSGLRRKERIMREIEQDGFITDEIYIQETPSRRGIELQESGDGKAVPATECRYPNCEECDDYIRFKGANYCTVPMVLNKQTWRLTADLIADMQKKIDELQEDVITLMIHSPHIPRG